jgi:hypothetical protein
MRTLCIGTLILALGIYQGAAGVPDPCSEITPWLDIAYVTPGPNSEGGVGEVIITVRNDNCDPIPNADVWIDLSDCQDLCINPGDAGLAGTTNAEGVVVLNPQVGGCEDCLVIIRANGVTIFAYPRITSTDWNGQEADGVVGVADFAFFSTAFKVTQDLCADYNGDGAVNGTDFSIFATSFKRADENPGGCE